MAVAILLSLMLALIAGFSIRAQIQQLRLLRDGPTLASDDRRYLRNRSRRRIANGGIMFLLAAMLAGSYLSGLEDKATEIGDRRAEAMKAEVPIPLAPEDKEFIRLYTWYWIALLLLLFVIMAVAVVDFWSTRRYALSQLKRIREDQQAMLARDLAMFRQAKLNDRIRPRD